MKIMFLLFTLSSTLFADSWEIENAINQASQAQIKATQQTAQAQTAALNAQTEQIQQQNLDSYLANEDAHNLQLMQLHMNAAKWQQVNNSCTYRMIVDKAQKSVTYTDPNSGKSIGPIYVKDCTNAKAEWK